MAATASGGSHFAQSGLVTEALKTNRRARRRAQGTDLVDVLASGHTVRMTRLQPSGEEYGAARPSLESEWVLFKGPTLSGQKWRIGG